MERFLTLRDTAFQDLQVVLPSLCAVVGRGSRRPRRLAIWERTNLANLEDNILPTRPRATLILKKGADHVVETVALRRL